MAFNNNYFNLTQYNIDSMQRDIIVYNSTTGLLGIAFVVLKLLHVIEWSWIWILAPFWIPVALVLAFAIITLIVVGLVYLKNNKLK